jgi:hypothetical protein
MFGWRAYGEAWRVNSCGHKQEVPLVSDGDGRCRGVTILGDAA